jgi:hypothetical protein
MVTALGEVTLRVPRRLPQLPNMVPQLPNMAPATIRRKQTRDVPAAAS